MTGKPGRGGARPGAGRPPKPKAEPASLQVLEADDMLDLLQKVALGQIEATTIQVRAAIAAVQYTHTKRADGGKKEAEAEEAEKASEGKFKPRHGPKLVASR